MGSTGKTGVGVSTSTSIPSIVGTQKISMSDGDTQALKDALTFYKQRYTNILNDPQAVAEAKQRSQERSDAIDQLIAYGGIPKTSTGRVAEMLVDVLPPGSTITVINARRPNFNGTWINRADQASSVGKSWTLTRDGNGRLAIAQPQVTAAHALIDPNTTTIRVDKVGRFR